MEYEPLTPKMVSWEQKAAYFFCNNPPAPPILPGGAKAFSSCRLPVSLHRPEVF